MKLACKSGRVVELLEPRRLLSGDAPLISEFMASNRNTINDPFGESSDWVEIWNPTAGPLDLAGWHLTDDPDDVAKWTIPADTSLQAGEHKVIWASGRDMVDAEGGLHTNFKLKSSGEYLALVDPSSIVVSAFGSAEMNYPVQETDVSYGVQQSQVDLDTAWYFVAPTPGGPNGEGVQGFVAETTVSHERGFYEEPIQVQIASATAGATLIYTTDGSLPSATNGVQVTPPDDQSPPATSLIIDGTTTLRSMAFRTDWLPTTINTHNYLYLEDVIRQTGAGLPDTWGHAGADYEMDPDVVNDPRYRDEIVDDLLAIPSLSLVTDIDNWFGPRRKGIYPSGQGSPRPVSVELILADGSEGFQVDGSVEIQGGSSTNRWKSDKLSMQLKFKREYGDAKLTYPLFGDAATDEFDTLILDARLNQGWHYGGGAEPTVQRARTQFTRDQFAADLQNLMGGRGPAGQFVHLYLNGIYWGLHNLHERPDEHFAAAYFGGDADDYDVIKHNDVVVSGGFRNYRVLINAVNRDLTDPANYQAVVEMLDIDQLTSYVLMNYYVGNSDWAHHNWYATYNRVAEDGKWRFHSWDAEHILKDLGDNVTGRDDPLGPTHIHQRLMKNDEYRLEFMDTVQKYLFNDGLLTPDRVAEVYQLRLDAVEKAVVAESARWGDNRRRVPYTRDVDWVAERDRLLNDYFPSRTDTVLSQLRRRGFFHRFDAPAFSQHGGEVVPGSKIEITTSRGDIFFTTDGSDPRRSESALNYTSPIVIDQDVVIRTRSLAAGEWSAVTEAAFLSSADPRGDFDGNGTLEAQDIDMLFAAIGAQSNQPVFDLNEYSSIDHADVTYFVEQLKGTRRGDVDLNGDVAFRDFLTLAANFGKADATWADGDFSGDGSITFEDFLLLATNFGYLAANGVVV